MSDHKFQRRSRVDLRTPAESAIGNAILEVEKVGADTRLTEAVILLEQAKNKLADYMDEQITNCFL